MPMPPTLCLDDTLCYLPECAEHGCMSRLGAEVEGLSIGLEQRGEKSAANLCRRIAKLLKAKKQPPINCNEGLFKAERKAMRELIGR